MILIDTSVWIDHFRRPEVTLMQIAGALQLVQHPFVTMELALGSIPDRITTIGALQMLTQTMVSPHADLHGFVERNLLHGTGIGMVDAHLLASAAAERHRIWTRDKRLKAQAERLNLAFAE